MTGCFENHSSRAAVEVNLQQLKVERESTRGGSCFDLPLRRRWPVTTFETLSRMATGVAVPALAAPGIRSRLTSVSPQLFTRQRYRPARSPRLSLRRKSMRSCSTRTQHGARPRDRRLDQPEEGQHVRSIPPLLVLGPADPPLPSHRPREAAVQVIRLVNHRNTHVAMLALHVRPSLIPPRPNCR